MADLAERRQFHFESFAVQPEYVGVNHQFVDRALDVRPGAFVVDFACGTGLITQRIRDRFAGIQATVIGIDPNPAALEKAREKVPSIGGTTVEFVEGSADTVKEILRPGSVDITYFCNAIHEIGDEATQRAILEALSSGLKVGGKLPVNSAFTDEWAADTRALREMGMWKMQTIRRLGRTRIKGMTGGFTTHPTEYYVGLIKDAGLEVTDEDVQVKTVNLTPDSMRAIAEYDGFINGVFSDMEGTDDVPLDEKSAALVEVMNEMEEAAAAKGEPLVFKRNWVEIVGRKPKG